ncbi:MAG: Jag N-terminal domain-containing protein [Clostridia bacterium]|nr:Jag N-terminal domain-containing protein [Clostridia bacterium]
MREEYEFKAKTLEEATEKGRAELGDKVDDMEFEVVKMPTSGFFGIGASPAVIRYFREIPDEVPAEKAETLRERTAGAAAENVPHEKKPKNTQPLKEKGPETAKGKTPPAAKEKNVSPVRTRHADGSEAIKFVEMVIDDFGIDAEATEKIEEDGSVSIDISGNDAGTLIGHHGDSLDSLQYLANLCVNHGRDKENEDYRKVSIDIEGYRIKREETLRQLARRMADKVLKYNRSFTLEPMKPSERRIIHSEIQDIEGVCTTSIGSDENRKVVVYPEGGSPTSDRYRGRGRNHGGYGRSHSRNGSSGKEEAE